MKNIKIEYINGRDTWVDTIIINSDNKLNNCKHFKIKEVEKTFKGINQFIILMEKHIFLSFYKWKVLRDKECFERRIPLYFNSVSEACNHITQLEN